MPPNVIPITIETLPDNSVLLQVFGGTFWEPHKFSNREEADIWLFQNYRICQ